MACRVEERPCVGVSCGRRCGVCAIVSFTLLLIMSTGYSLTARLYLQAYYTSSQVAAITVMTSLFVLTHHTSCVYSASCCTARGYYITQSVLNLFYLLCCTVLSIGYIMLSVFSVHYNFDYIASAGFGVLSVVAMLYLCTLTLASSTGGHRSDYEVDIKFVWQSDDSGMHTDMDLHDSSVDITSKSKKSLVQKQQSTCSCAKCCTLTFKLIFGIIYTILQILLIVIFGLIAAQPVFVSFDINMNRDSDDLYTVDINGHYPQALFLKCTGSGNDTIILENDIGVTGYMQWNYLPRHLSDMYRVCIYNRRGYGWSETFENDDITTAQSGKEWLKNQADYFHKLLKKSNVRTPVYYAAHGFGSYIMTQVAIEYPDVIKGLIYLDPIQGMEIGFEDPYVELMCNVNAMSAMHIATMTPWYDVTQHVPALKFFDNLPTKIKDKIECDLRQSYYLPTYKQENDNLKSKSLKDVIGSRMVAPPLLVINAHSKSAQWFPTAQFTEWNDELYIGIPGAGHEDVVFNGKYANITSRIVEAFIRYTYTSSLDDLLLITSIPTS